MQIEVVAEVDGWLHCVASNGAKGLVPSSYVHLLGAGENPELQQQYSNKVSTHWTRMSFMPAKLLVCHNVCLLNALSQGQCGAFAWQHICTYQNVPRHTPA